MAERESVLVFVVPLLTVLLARLRAPEFALKDEQKEAILAVYEENGRLCEPIPTGFVKNIFFQILPFVFDHKSVV